MSQTRTIPQLPQIGLAELEYKRLIAEADSYRDPHAREAFKVAKYITRAISKGHTWPQRLKYFKHALEQHCRPPRAADEETISFYGTLAHLVRQHAGEQVLRHVSKIDDAYAARISKGEHPNLIAREATAFFRALLPHHHRPEWLNLEDYEQVKVFENQWARNAGQAGLHGSSLHGSTFHGSSLHGSTLNGSSLDGSTLRGGSLHGSSLHGSTLHGESDT